VRRPDDGLIHEALIYASQDEFVAALVPFVREGLALGQPTFAVLPGAKSTLLREALEQDARLVDFVDATTLYRSPANAIAEYRRRATELSRAGIGMTRLIGEVQFETSGREHDDWMRYESVFNAVFARSPTWVVCLYDTRVLPEQTIVDAERTHPFVRTGGGERTSANYVAPEELSLRPPERDPNRDHVEQLARLTAETEGDLVEVRRSVGRAARAAGLATAVVDDVTVAVNELVGEALAQGAPKASVEIARAGAQWLCEVTTETAMHETLLRDDSPGLRIAHLISDRVDVVSDAGGVSVRLMFSATMPNARRRILDAAGQLFYQKGIRATGINTIISQSGVAKATFYHQFPSKDALLVAWLQQPETRWLDRVRIEAEARAQSPEQRLLTFFDVLGERLAQHDFRGCVYLNAAAEIPQHDHPARQVIREYMQEIREYFRRTASEAGLPFPDRHAEQLHDLAAGAIVTAVATSSPHTAKAARAAAEQLQILAQKA
jgi:AcrR family transcriptional regulator